MPFHKSHDYSSDPSAARNPKLFSDKIFIFFFVSFNFFFLVYFSIDPSSAAKRKYDDPVSSGFALPWPVQPTAVLHRRPQRARGIARGGRDCCFFFPFNSSFFFIITFFLSPFDRARPTTRASFRIKELEHHAVVDTWSVQSATRLPAGDAAVERVDRVSPADPRPLHPWGRLEAEVPSARSYAQSLVVLALSLAYSQ